MTPVQATALAILMLYLLLFFASTTAAARVAGTSAWLSNRARGAQRIAMAAFRLSFALAILGPLAWALAPAWAVNDPLWQVWGGFGSVPGTVGAAFGGMIAWASQLSMGASWRVGVDDGAGLGMFVTGGLYELSRNPTYVGHILLLSGVCAAVPSSPGLLSVALYVGAVLTQVPREEQALQARFGAEYAAYRKRVRRWL